MHDYIQSRGISSKKAQETWNIQTQGKIPIHWNEVMKKLPKEEDQIMKIKEDKKNKKHIFHNIEKFLKAIER